MVSIKRFSTFVNEAVGLAKPTLIYSEFILKEFEKHFNLYIDSGEVSKEYSIVYDLIDTDIIKDNLWYKFPIRNIDINFDFESISDSEFEEKFGTSIELCKFTTYGLSYQLSKTKGDYLSYLLPAIDDRVENTIHLKIDIKALLSESFDNLEGLLLEVESTLIHELHHVYENYMRMITNKGFLSVNITNSTDVNRSKIKGEIFNKWKDEIGMYVYWAEKHEIGAMVQDSWPYVKKYEIEEMMEKCPSWFNSERMKEFNWKVFKSEMVDLIKSTYPDADPELMISRLKNGLANQIGSESRFDYEDIPYLKPDKIKRMTNDKFLEFVQELANNTGKKLQRKILKLYSLK